MISLSGASAIGLGAILGFKHALDADHVAAVATIVSESKDVRGSSLVGLLWGVGHTLALSAAGVAVILLHCEIGPRVAEALELCVALMLIGLGVNALRTLARGGTLHLHVHQHGGRIHAHPHLHDDAPEPSRLTHHGLSLRGRPLLVGVVHGLAGSAALTLLVVSSMPSTVLGLAFIGAFGIGSVVGMILLSAVVSVPVHLGAAHFARAQVVARAAAAVFSLGWGILMAYGIGMRGGL